MLISYHTDIIESEVDRIVPLLRPRVERTIVYNGSNGRDFIHFGTSNEKVTMTVLDGYRHIESALRHIEGELERYIEIDLI